MSMRKPSASACAHPYAPQVDHLQRLGLRADMVSAASPPARALQVHPYPHLHCCTAAESTSMLHTLLWYAIFTAAESTSMPAASVDQHASSISPFARALQPPVYPRLLCCCAAVLRCCCIKDGGYARPYARPALGPAPGGCSSTPHASCLRLVQDERAGALYPASCLSLVCRRWRKPAGVWVARCST
jgi:hypothetical protein